MIHVYIYILRMFNVISLFIVYVLFLGLCMYWFVRSRPTLVQTGLANTAEVHERQKMYGSIYFMGDHNCHNDSNGTWCPTSNVAVQLAPEHVLASRPHERCVTVFRGTPGRSWEC